jgi:hypothetical protein
VSSATPGAPRRMPPGWALALPAFALLTFLFWFRTPDRFLDAYLGEPTYGAYQETLWWFRYLLDHLLEPGAWFHSDLQKYPWGMQPHVLYANDFLVPLLAAPFMAVLPLNIAINAFLWVVLVANAMAGRYAARGLGAPGWAAFVAGLLFACTGFLHTQLLFGRLSLALLFPIPLFLLWWHRACTERGRGPLLAAIVTLVVAGLIYPYYAAFLAMLAPLVGLLGPGSKRQTLLRCGLLFAGAALVLAPVSLPLLSDWGSITAFASDCQAYAPLRADLPSGYCAMFQHSLWLHHLPGTLADPLVAGCLLGLAFPGRPRRWALLGLAALVLSLGPYAVGLGPAGRPQCLAAFPLPFAWLWHIVPGLEGLSHPYRLLALAHALGAVVLAAALGRAHTRWLHGRWPRLVPALVVSAAVALLAMRPAIHVGGPPDDVPGLQQIGDGHSPLILLPLLDSDLLVFQQIEHQRPMLNGDGLRVAHKNHPELQRALEEDPVLLWLSALTEHQVASRPPTQEEIAQVRALGFTHVVLCTWVADLPPFAKPTGEPVRQALSHQTMAQAAGQLEAVLGPPTLRDHQLVAYSLDDE